MSFTDDDTPAVTRGRRNSSASARGMNSRSTSQAVYTRSGKRKRARVFTADDRATHAVTEKQRREALNAQFVDLARLTPSLATTRRLSKTAIVTEATIHSRKQYAQRLACAKELRKMLATQNTLVQEINALRAQLGLGVRESQGEGEELGVSREAKEALDVENEVFGAFPNGFGDNSDEALEEMADEAMDAAERAASASSSGLDDGSGDDGHRRRRLTSRSVSTTASERTPSSATTSRSPAAMAHDTRSPTSYDTDFLSMLSAVPEPPFVFDLLAHDFNSRQTYPEPQQQQLHLQLEIPDFLPINDMDMTSPHSSSIVTAAGSPFPPPIDDGSTSTQVQNPLLLNPEAWQRFLALSNSGLGIGASAPDVSLFGNDLNSLDLLGGEFTSGIGYAQGHSNSLMHLGTHGGFIV
ncbi:hypothetical protein C8F01DRAFT_1053877 [Mycena amicta]|nr:hypothetical protein C8F01DRAFT_1053877 [Mycena amicta]